LSSVCAFCWSFQKSGAEASVSIAAARLSAPSTSKMPAEDVELSPEGRDPFLEWFDVH
jgi:hypothetical protein